MKTFTWSKKIKCGFKPNQTQYYCHSFGQIEIKTIPVPSGMCVTCQCFILIHQHVDSWVLHGSRCAQFSSQPGTRSPGCPGRSFLVAHAINGFRTTASTLKMIQPGRNVLACREVLRKPRLFKDTEAHKSLTPDAQRSAQHSSTRGELIGIC